MVAEELVEETRELGEGDSCNDIIDDDDEDEEGEVMMADW